VEMLLIFAFGRPDILPVDDFGVREGWRRLQKLDVQLKPKVMAAVGEAWSPYRSTATWYLWRAAEEGRTIKQPGALPTVAPVAKTPTPSPRKPPVARRAASARRP
jgi:3-methyladenine DNA glycosylase/8-oxoguanine DNA glycosylase